MTARAPARTRSRILLVEDTASLAALYAQHVSSQGHLVETAGTGAQARSMLASQAYDAVLLDLGLPDIAGIDLLREIRRADAPSHVIVITANASIAMAVQAVREGAYDYLIKPVNRDRLVTTLANALERGVPKTARAPDAPQQRDSDFMGFTGTSPAMRKVYDTIRSVARSKASVFITGESGTGKELCAEAVHRASPRAAGPFIALNCGAIPKDLMESEIFGHLKGSFTGAISDRDGAAAMADGGTLFLDEICELDLTLQTKLLRFLQTGVIQPVGATATQKVDIRIVCATNRSPLDEVKAARFREDLYFRLHVLPIHMPRLHDRGDDALALARHMLSTFAREEGKTFESISQAAEQTLMAHDWPGNVRELQNAMRQAVVLNDGPVLEVDMLSGLVAHRGQRVPAQTGCAPEIDVEDLRRDLPRSSSPAPVGLELWEIEKQAIEQTIASCDGSVPRAARLLGVSPSTIYRKRESWSNRIH